MNKPTTVSTATILAEIRALAKPLHTAADLTPLVERVGDKRFVCIGEASHGTHEFYGWRAELSRRLIEERGFNWIGVEGDWPDCWRINRWARGITDQHLDAREMLASFERWPTWMWANTDVADFLDWLRDWNAVRPDSQRVGFYGLDVYSLWDSLRVTMDWLAEHAPESLEAATQAWQCFEPYGEDPHRYATGTRLVPQSCESEVVSLLAEIVHRTRRATGEADGDAAFDAVQNAVTAVEAERYYRIMVRGSRESWNLRDRHMTDTITRLDGHIGPDAKGLIWEHNTHVGDARATDMAGAGMFNVGQLLRERYGSDRVALIGFAGYRGTVIAARTWGAQERRMPVPEARRGSHESLLHHALGRPALLLFFGGKALNWPRIRAGHRAIGVIYQPDRETGNYVPTVMGDRYDALLWLEDTTALKPLHHEPTSGQVEFETEPSGF